ncbi:MAG: helix-turn-helix transcriptional regulator [Proteobacteria bacterium]|nr:helix-turn-helix transcriptional regulator [Pseudomonadota bacterium]
MAGHENFDLDAPVPLSEQLMRGNVLAANCPSRDVLKHLTSRWGVLVVIALERRMHRFSELRRTIGGVSERMLAQTLQQLEADGMVARVAYQVVPPHVEYSLTPLGREAAEKVRALADWIEVSLPRISMHRRTAKAGRDDDLRESAL